MLKRLGLVDGLGIFVVAFVVAKPWNMAIDPGLGWHLRSGQWMVEHGRIIRTDPFLFTTQDRPWVHTQWLSDVVLSSLFTIGGLPLLHMLAIGLVLGTVLFVLAPLLRTVTGPFAVAITCIVALALVAVQWVLRPLLVSILLFAVTYRLAHGWYEAPRGPGLRDWGRRAPAIIVLFALWPNLHAGYLVGIGLLAILTVSFTSREDWPRPERLRASFGAGALTAVALAASLINPYGLALLSNNLGLVGDRYFMNLNTEWLSVDFHQRIFAPLLILVLILIVLGARRGRVLSAFDLAALAVFVYFALMHRRGIPFLAIAVSVPLAKLLGSLSGGTGAPSGPAPPRAALRRFAARDARASRGGYTAVLWVLAVTATLMSGRVPSSSSQASNLDIHVSAAAMTALEARVAEHAPGSVRVFHTPNWGGYLTYRLWPRLQPFVDDRNELNGRRIYEDFFTLSNLGAGWEQVLDRYRFDGLLLEPWMPLVAMARRLPGWQVDHEDDRAVLFWRRPEAPSGRR